MTQQDKPQAPTSASEGQRARPSRKGRRVRRRRLIQTAVGVGAGLAAASGAYVAPSVRPLRVSTAYAFSF
jgi:hypothetical protein